MSMYRHIAFAVAAASAAAMLHVGLYQSRLVGCLICPIFGEGCEGVADAPFARPFGIPDGYIGAVLYIVIIALLLSPPNRWGWIALLVLSFPPLPSEGEGHTFESCRVRYFPIVR